ncbi:MAG: DHHA2 domain-containing protein [Patescibacteria group bacterium]
MGSRSTTLVTGYVNPDLDGFASAVAYAEFLERQGRPIQAGILGAPHDEVKYILKRFGLAGPAEIAGTDDFDDVILVDASDLNGLEGRVSPEKVIEIIDHRLVHEAGKFPRAKAQIEPVGAAATLVAEKFKQAGDIISQRSAILLYSAIISNTLNFKASVTTERDREMAKWLEQFVEIPADYWRELFIAKSDLAGDKLAARIHGDFAWFVLGDKRAGIAQLEIIGAAELIRERNTEIEAVLNQLKADHNLDYIFQNTIDLEQGRNFFIAPDSQTQNLLAQVLSVNFSGTLAIGDRLLMRKQIVPLLRAELEHPRLNL